MGDLSLIFCLVAVVALAAFLAVALTFFSAPPPAPVIAAQWRQVIVQGNRSFWREFQQEVLAEVQRAPRLGQAPANGAPDPTSGVPPLYLYHGTRRAHLASIFARGIEGRTGGWAFTAPDYQTAEQYGRTRGGADYVILRVLAQQAYQNGVRFERRGAYWVTSFIHPQFLDFHWTLADYAARRGAQM